MLRPDFPKIGCIMFKNFSVRDTFDQPKAPPQFTVEGFADDSNPLIPKRDDLYVFDRIKLRDILAFAADPMGDAMWIGGPYGAGKTSIVTQTLSRLNWPTMCFSWHKRREFADLVGHQAIVGGQTKFVHGPLPVCMTHGYALVINEADRGDAGELVGLNDILEGSPLVIPETNEVIHAHPKFRLFVTANSMGSGDASGLYATSIQVLDPAFLDRFRFISVGYLEPDIEESILERVAPKVPQAIRENMIKVANEIRRLFLGGEDGGSELSLTMSTRSLVRWARLTVAFKGAPNAVGFALERAFSNRAEPEQRQAIHQIAADVFGDLWEAN